MWPGDELLLLAVRKLLATDAHFVGCYRLEMQNARFTRLVPLALLLAAPLIGGCRGPRVHMYPDAPVVEDGVRIAVRDAWKRGDRLVVRADVVNRGADSITLSRSDFTLRLDDGSMLRVREGRRATKAIHIPKGSDATVTMEFDAPEVREISNATLLIASTSGRDDESLAEVKLATATNAKTFGKKRKKNRTPPEAIAAVEAEDTELEAASSDDADEEELNDSDEEEPEGYAEVDEEPEDWVIGSQ